ncbi:MAG: hypothetical protein ABI629_19770 [bacterium]
MTSERFCGYVGDTNGPCTGTFVSGAGWATDGTAVTLILVDPSGATLGVDAQRMNQTTAKVKAVALGPDFSDPVAASGTVAIPSNTRLTVNFDLGTDCGVLTYAGTFDGLLGANAVTTESVAMLRQVLKSSGQPTPSADVSGGMVRRARAVLEAYNFQRRPDFRRADREVHR